MGGIRSAARHKTLAGIATAFAFGATLVLSGAAAALSSPTPWNGDNPFHCQIQNAGFGTKVPNPGADPYCVRFDKTNQNFAQLGIVTFLSKEPARVAAAVPKCFYFQEDQWRGSIVQSDKSTVLYHFTGHYFFNKATGDGGVWVDDFTVAGHTFDPRTLPGFPPQYRKFFGPGRGGFITHDDVPADPTCAAKANQMSSIFRRGAGNPDSAAIPVLGPLLEHVG